MPSQLHVSRFVAMHKRVSLKGFSAKLFPTQALLQLGGSALHMSLTRICLLVPYDARSMASQVTIHGMPESRSPTTRVADGMAFRDGNLPLFLSFAQSTVMIAVIAEPNGLVPRCRSWFGEN